MRSAAVLGNVCLVIGLARFADGEIEVGTLADALIGGGEGMGVEAAAAWRELGTMLLNERFK